MTQTSTSKVNTIHTKAHNTCTLAAFAVIYNTHKIYHHTIQPWQPETDPLPHASGACWLPFYLHSTYYVHQRYAQLSPNSGHLLDYCLREDQCRCKGILTSLLCSRRKHPLHNCSTAINLISPSPHLTYSPSVSSAPMHFFVTTVSIKVNRYVSTFSYWQQYHYWDTRYGANLSLAISPQLHPPLHQRQQVWEQLHCSGENARVDRNNSIEWRRN